MKLRSTSLSGCKLKIIAGLLCVASISRSVNPQTNAQAKPGSNGAPAAPPQSVFLLPRTPQDGRDPFFPKSTYIFAHAPVVAVTNAQPVVVHADLKLQGFSGSPAHRLAIINGRTFEAGEEAEVTTNAGRVSVRCLEIKGEVVTVQVGAERQELKMRSGF
jgi:hypothetical protein